VPNSIGVKIVHLGFSWPSEAETASLFPAAKETAATAKKLNRKVNFFIITLLLIKRYRSKCCGMNFPRFNQNDLSIVE
jgi:hypothetical protein